MATGVTSAGERKAIPARPQEEVETEDPENNFRLAEFQQGAMSEWRAD
jgi:hypothetical protein